MCVSVNTKSDEFPLGRLQFSNDRGGTWPFCERHDLHNVVTEVKFVCQSGRRAAMHPRSPMRWQSFSITNTLERVTVILTVYSVLTLLCIKWSMKFIYLSARQSFADQVGNRQQQITTADLMNFSDWFLGFAASPQTLPITLQHRSKLTAANHIDLAVNFGFRESPRSIETARRARGRPIPRVTAQGHARAHETRYMSVRYECHMQECHEIRI